MTAPTGAFPSPGLGEANELPLSGSVLSHLGRSDGLPPAALTDPAAQVMASPGVVPEEPARYGDPGDWARWTAVGAGTALLAPKVSTEVTGPLRDSVHDRYRLLSASPEVQDRVHRLQNLTGTHTPSTWDRLKDGTAGGRSVIRNLGGGLASRVAERVPGGRTVSSLGRGAATAIASRVGPQSAGLAARMGLRLALFAIPGPGWAIGAAVFAATWMFDDSMRRLVNNLTGKLFGVNNSPSLDTPPEPPRTLFLPLTHDGDRDSVIEMKDGEIALLNNAAFGFDPDKVWHPSAPAIETTPKFEQASAAFEELITRTVALREEADSIFRKYRGEQAVDKAAEATSSALNSLDEFGASILPAVANLVSAHAVRTNNLYMQLRDANLSAREEIANSGAGLLPWTSSVDASRMGQLVNAYDTYALEQDADNKAVEKVFAEWTPPATPSGRLNLPTPTAGGVVPHTDIVAPESPRAGTSSLPTRATEREPQASGTSKQDVLDALRAVGTPLPASTSSQPAAATSPSPGMNDPFGVGMSNPFGAGMNDPFAAAMNDPLGMAAGSPFGVGLSNPIGSGIGSPAASLPTNLQPTSGAKGESARIESKLRDLLNRDQPAKDTVAEERAESAEVEETAEVDSPGGVAVPVENDPSQPAGLSVPDTQKTADTPGDAVSAALGLEPSEEQPEASSPQVKTAEVGGKLIEFEDHRSARMAEIMQPTDGTAPPTVHEAAAAAGYVLPPAGEPIGERVSTADLRVGDLIMGEHDRNGLYLGDAKVLTGGEVRPVADVATFTEDGHGLFRLEDAPSPEEVGVPGPDQGPADPRSPETADSERELAFSADPSSDETESPQTPDEGSSTPADRAEDDAATGEMEAPTGAMPLPRSSTPTSSRGSDIPAAPMVPTGD